MERRTFLYSVPFGLIGFKSLASSMTSPCESTLEGKIDPFFDLFGVKPASIFFETNEIESLIQVHASSLIHIGYTVPNRTMIWERDHQLAFAPVSLEREGLGILDVVMLVMRYNNERSNWEYTGSLSGFQMESLLRIPISECIPTSEKASLQEWLLPSFRSGVHTSDGCSYKTNRGKYQTTVNISEGQTIIDSKLYDKDNIIWSDHYGSKLPLCKSSTFFI